MKAARDNKSPFDLREISPMIMLLRARIPFLVIKHWIESVLRAEYREILFWL